MSLKALFSTLLVPCLYRLHHCLAVLRVHHSLTGVLLPPVFLLLTFLGIGQAVHDVEDEQTDGTLIQILQYEQDLEGEVELQLFY